MLAQLTIQNLVVIEQASVEFDPRLNVLTGQTGAGKSLLLGAIEALLGLRPAKDLLRPGQKEGRVTGLFHLQDQTSRESVARLLDEAEPLDEIVISRRFYETRTLVTANGHPIAAGTLRSLAEILIDIHGQHEHQYLLKPSNQLDVLTTYADANPLAEQTRRAWQTWQQLQRMADDLTTGRQQRAQQIDFLRFQINEIDNIKPEVQELADLQAEHKKLANVERLRLATSQVLGVLSDREDAALDLLRQAASGLADIARLDPSTAALQQACDDAAASLNELALDVARYSDSLETDPSRLEFVETRIEAIRRLCRKYGPDVQDVLDHRHKIDGQLQALETAETDMTQLQGRIDAANREYMTLAGKLTQRRLAASKRLASAVMMELSDLGMDKATFSIDTQASPPGPTGLETVEFMISANPGLPLRPLRSVASGGELSRVMLALKSVLSTDSRCSVLVFDEIDANVGGRMGSVIGRKLAALASRNQVLCITHLPQIAAYADRHMTIQKTSNARSTRTSVTLLVDDAQRVSELAEMIAGKNITEATTRQAEQLLQEARSRPSPKGASTSPEPSQKQPQRSRRKT